MQSRRPCLTFLSTAELLKMKGERKKNCFAIHSNWVVKRHNSWHFPAENTSFMATRGRQGQQSAKLSICCSTIHHARARRRRRRRRPKAINVFHFDVECHTFVSTFYRLQLGTRRQTYIQLRFMRTFCGSIIFQVSGNAVIKYTRLVSDRLICF